MIPLILLLPQDGDVSVTESRFEFLNAPPLWTIILLIIPALVLVVGYVYGREAESATPRVKRFLAGFRMLVLLVVLMVLFQPVNRSQVFSVHRSIVAFLVDKSASMDRPEEYDDELGDLFSGHLVPAYFFLDDSGQITKKLIGFKNEQEVLAEVGPLLSGVPGSDASTLGGAR